MIVYTNSIFKSFTPIKLSSNEINNLHLPIGLESIANSITKIDGEYYYYKSVSSKQMINELIGSYLSKIINLDAVDYQIGFFNKDLYALSRVFYNADNSYTNCYDFFMTKPNNQLTRLEASISKFYLNQTNILDQISDWKMVSNILKLIAVDLKMGQTDRHNMNLTIKFCKKNNEMDLAPIYDFEKSYHKLSSYKGLHFYDNPFIMLRKNKISLYKFGRKYPEVAEFAELLTHIDIGDILSEIENEKKVVFSIQEKEYYQNNDIKHNKVLQKIY